MVDFTLTDEQKDLRELAHSFAEKDMRSVAWEYDKDGTWPADVIQKAWEVGLMNTHIPEAYGGPGLDYLSGCLIEEEMGWGCSGIGTSLMANGLASAPITLGGSEETKKKYLGMLCEEPKLASFCLTEPDAGSDVSGMKTKAVKKGDKYVISGSKCFITNGTYADYFTVYAKTDPEAGHRGISAFVVDADLPGVTVDKKEDKMGQRASNTATISFDEVEIPAENLLGEENKGFKLAMMTLDRTRPGVSAMAVGIGRAALEYATDYSKERVQFGVPIAMHQAIQFMIADMATKVEAARLLVWNSAVMLDQGQRNSKVSSMAKRFAADSAMEITTDAVQVYGGYGFIKEYPVEKLMRDAKIMQLYEGTSQIQRLVIAKEVLLPRAVGEPTPEAEAKAAKDVREQPDRAGSGDGLSHECPGARRGRKGGALQGAPLLPRGMGALRGPGGPGRGPRGPGASRGSRSCCRSATGGWRPRRSPSIAAPPRSWPPTSRTPRPPACGCRPAATPTSRTSASSRRPTGGSSSTSTTSTRACRAPGSGT